MKIYHYTTLKNLILIIASKKLRFNRLDKVDDIEETLYAAQNYNMDLYTFVSCWTKEREENIALWKMYSGYDGVRIGIDSDFLVSHSPKIGDYKTYFEQMLYFGEDYCVTQPNNHVELRDIKYTDEIVKLKSDCISFPEPNKISVDTSHSGNTKRKNWEFQKESRFIIQTMPVNPIYLKGLIPEQLNTMNVEDLIKANFTITPAMVRSFQEHYPLKTQFIDIPIKDSALDCVEITLGPQAGEAERMIVKYILRDYKNVSIIPSTLSGFIRK